MAAAAAIGESLEVEGYALAGVSVLPADNPEQAAAAWTALPADTALLIMTASAARWLDRRLAERPGLLTVVIQP